MTLNPLQIQLAEQLLLAIKNHEGRVEYNELAARVTPPIHSRQVGKNIEKVSLLCHELGLPLISAMVVRKGQGTASSGFYRLYVECGIPTDGCSEQELFHRECQAIRQCTQWYKLEDALSLHVGMDRPDGLLNSHAPVPYAKSVDVLNRVFGERYLGKTYGGWQKAALKFTANGSNYLIWFPKISVDGSAASSSGWINTCSADGRVITESVSSTGTVADYELDESIRLVFGKTGNGPYLFCGVFVPDMAMSRAGYHVFRKQADVADFRGSVPEITVLDPEIVDDDVLVRELNGACLPEAGKKFVHQGKVKPKAVPLMVHNHLVYPRSKQTAINALSHAGFVCEIDAAHPTFLRRNSDKPYTEPHHLVPMSASADFAHSLDVEENIVSLCSTCHNQIHYGQGAEALLRRLYDERKDGLRRVHIELSFQQLLDYYQK